MNIAIDVDDTLTDTFDYFIPFVAEYFGWDERELREKRISYSNLPPGYRHEELALVKAYGDKFVPYTPFKKGAREAVAALKAAGHRIVIVTARADTFYTDPYKTTEDELRNGGIDYDKLVCAMDKSKVYEAEKIDLVLDDGMTNIAAATDLGIKAIVFTTPANENVNTACPRVNNWEEAMREIKRVTG